MIPNRRLAREKAAHVVNPQKAQQEERRRSSENALRQRVFEHCGEGVPKEADLFELGWSNGRVVVSYLTYEDCGKKGHHVVEDKGQRVVKGKELEKLKKCEECAREGRRKAARPTKRKAQQSDTQARDLEGTAREEGNQREVRRTFKMLKEVWLDIRIERTDTHKGVMIKALLDSGATEMFIDRKTVTKHGFKLQKLERPVRVKNVDRTYNSEEAITYEVEVNVYYKSYVERIRMDICDLGRTEVILGIPWLVAHNPEINWETGEVKMIRCPSLCDRVKIREKKKEGRRVVILKEEKIVRWVINNKEDWGKEEEIEEDHRKIEEMVPKRFLKWIRKGYIRPTKSPRTSLVFFVGKKDGKKRMVMDYRNLNSQMVKNNYPLLLITELIDNMGDKKVFTKIDFRWGFNNVRIKEGDEWKGAVRGHLG